MAKPCTELCQKWTDWNEKGCIDPSPLSSEDLKSLSPAQIQEFLAQLLLRPALSCKAIETMQKFYSFNNVQNCEIRFRYSSFEVNFINSYNFL